MALAVSSAVVTVWAPATGASFTELTWMLKPFEALLSTPPKAVPPLSCTKTVTVALPDWLSAGVKVSVPSALIAGPALKRFVLLLLTTNVTVWSEDSLAPAEMS